VLCPLPPRGAIWPGEGGGAAETVARGGERAAEGRVVTAGKQNTNSVVLILTSISFFFQIEEIYHFLHLHFLFFYILSPPRDGFIVDSYFFSQILSHGALNQLYELIF
jgi:hypothetical protein